MSPARLGSRAKGPAASGSDRQLRSGAGAPSASPSPTITQTSSARHTTGRRPDTSAATGCSSTPSLAWATVRCGITSSNSSSQGGVPKWSASRSVRRRKGAAGSGATHSTRRPNQST